MKNKKIWVVIGVFMLTLCLFSCGRTDADEQDPEEEQTVLTDEVETQHKHRRSRELKENEVAPTCEVGGSYDIVIYCTVCGDEISRTKITVAAAGHQYTNKKCEICGADQPSEGLYFGSNGNGTCFVIGMGDCKDENVIIPTVSPLGDRVTGIAASAFSGCEGLIGIRIPDTVTIMGVGVFQDCPDLVSVMLPSEITEIADFMFKNCKNLKNVTIPNRVIRIGEDAFVDCEAFESIVIPSSVKRIEINAFRNFSSCDGTVKFENPRGWVCYDSSGNFVRDFILTDEAKNTLYIAFMFNDCLWKRI